MAWCRPGDKPLSEPMLEITQFAFSCALVTVSSIFCSTVKLPLSPLYDGPSAHEAHSSGTTLKNMGKWVTEYNGHCWYKQNKAHQTQTYIDGIHGILQVKTILQNAICEGSLYCVQFIQGFMLPVAIKWVYCSRILTRHAMYIDGLVQERHNSSALAMELGLIALTQGYDSLAMKCLHMADCRICLCKILTLTYTCGLISIFVAVNYEPCIVQGCNYVTDGAFFVLWQLEVALVLLISFII